MRKLNVLMLTADFFPDTFGGVERYVFEISKGLAGRGHNVVVVARRARRGLPRSEEMAGFRVRRFPIISRPLPLFQITEAVGAWKTAQEAPRRDRFDIVHIHEALPGSLASGIAHRRGLPVIYTLHGPWGEEWRRAFLSRRPAFERAPLSLLPRLFEAYLCAVERMGLRPASRVVALSKYTRDILVSRYGVPAGRIRQIPGGVDIERFKPCADRREPRRQLGLEESALVMLTVRRLVPRMGLDNLLRAAALLRSELPAVKLLVGGAGALRDSLERLAGELGLRDTVRFLGAIPEDLLPSYYQAADIFVLPTLELEGFGLATLEALACGTPVVGTPAGGTPEILAPLERRLVTRDVSPGAIAEAVLWATREELLRPDMCRRCRTYVEKNYSWEACVERHEALYAECIGPGGRK